MEDKETKRQRIYKVIMLVALSVFITFMFTSLFMYNYYLDNDLSMEKKEIGSNKSNYEDLNRKLDMVQDKIDKYYLKDVNKEDLINGAISGYVEGLGDKYSKYITAEEMKDYTMLLKKDFPKILLRKIKDLKYT